MERRGELKVLDLAEWLAAGGSGAIFNLETSDLDVNLVRFTDNSGVGIHTNREVDVLLVAIAGEGVVVAGGVEHRLRAGQAIMIPKGVERAIRSPHNGTFGYLTVHRRRQGLWPAPRPRGSDGIDRQSDSHRGEGGR